MCLILVAWRAHEGYPLVVAANRDEHHARPSAQAGFWQDAPQVLAGRDLEGQGTWMGMTRDGRFAAVTNFRETAGTPAREARSRGTLVSRFLTGRMSAQAYVQAISAELGEYRGFNLLAGDGEALWYCSNRGGEAGALAPGVYGLSNHLLDTDWPKVRIGKRRLAQALSPAPNADALLRLLADPHPPLDHELPDTGVGLERERMLGPARIVSSLYGTRCSTVLLQRGDGQAEYAEKTWLPEGTEGALLRHTLRLGDAPA